MHNSLVKKYSLIKAICCVVLMQNMMPNNGTLVKSCLNVFEPSFAAAQAA